MRGWPVWRGARPLSGGALLIGLVLACSAAACGEDSTPGSGGAGGGGGDMSNASATASTGNTSSTGALSGGSGGSGGSGSGSGSGSSGGGSGGGSGGSGGEGGSGSGGGSGGAGSGGNGNGGSGGEPELLTAHVHIMPDNVCNLTVDPNEFTVPAGQKLKLSYHNHSNNIPVDVWMHYGGGYTDLAPGGVWNEQYEHCFGPIASEGYAEITACGNTTITLNIHCL